MEQDKRNMKLKLQTDAERDLDELRNRLEMEKQTQSAYTLQNRKVELQSQKDAKISSTKEQSHRDMQSQMDSKHNLFDMQLRNLKKEHEMRHEKELDFIKDRFRKKMTLMKDKIEQENSQLLEQSMDIDSHVQMFRADMINNKVDEQKFKIEEELRKKIKE